MESLEPLDGCRTAVYCPCPHGRSLANGMEKVSPNDP
jgi:hypothetical protein